MYELKRVVRAPVVWWRRRRAADQPTSAQAFLEHHRYSRAAHTVMAIRAVDPDYFHRTDLGPTAVVFDIGAFRGDGAAQIHRLYGSRVFAFEPNQIPYAALEKRFASDPNVVTLPYGLGPADAMMTMEVAGPASSVYGGVDSPAGTSEVEIRDIDAVLQDLATDRVDLMKVNIEGAEYDLLDRVIATGRIEDVRYLLIQFHEWHHAAHLRRWKIRRKLAKTHDQVWNYPWIWELWCAKSQPHPPTPPIDRATRDAVAAELRARAEARRTSQ